MTELADYFPIPIDGKFCPNDPRKFTLDSDFIYQDNEKDIRVVVPAGFTTDFSSVPGAFWSYMAPWEHPEAGLIHDWLYKAPGAFGSINRKPPLDQGQCDDLYRRILHLKGVRWTKRQLLWGILRSFGSRAWDKHRGADGKTAPEVTATDSPHVSLGNEEKVEV